MGVRTRNREPLHPAVFGTVLLMLVGVGRLPELVPGLELLALGNVAAVLGVLGLLIGRWKDDVPVLQTSTGRLLALFTLLAALSIGFSIWNGKSLEVFLNSLLTNVVLFYLIARTANSPRMLSIYAGTLVTCAAMLATEAVIGYTAGRVEVGRAYDSNDLAMVLVTILPFVVGGLLANRGLKRIVLAAVAVVMLLTVLLTGSRGGILGLIAVVGFLLFARFPRPSNRQRLRRLTPGKVIVVLAGGVLLVAAMPQLTLQRMATLGNLQSDYNLVSETGRIAIWTRGLEGMVERPWGHGLGTFEEVEMRKGGRFKAAHNIWIEVGVELGILGVVLLFAMFWTLVRTTSQLSERAFTELDADPRAPPQTKKVATMAVALKGALIGFFVTSFFLSVALTGVLYAVLALTAGLERQQWALANGEPWRGAGEDEGKQRRHGRGRGRPAHGATAFAGRNGHMKG